LQNSSQKIEYLWKLRDAQASDIRFADTKAGAARALSLSLVAATLSMASGALPQVAEPWGTIAKGALGLGCLCLVAMLALTALAIRPRFAWQQGHHEAGSHPPRHHPATHLPYRSVALRAHSARSSSPTPGHVYPRAVVVHASAAAFRQSWCEIDEGALADELADDVWRTALICQRKFTWIGKAVWCSAASALFAIIALLVLVLGRGA
jgi:hypothetical protein